MELVVMQIPRPALMRFLMYVMVCRREGGGGRGGDWLYVSRWHYGACLLYSRRRCVLLMWGCGPLYPVRYRGEGGGGCGEGRGG